MRQFESGLKKLGFDVQISNDRRRVNDDPCILFGTTFFTEIENAEGDWLLVDRASYGDPQFVQLVWNGHGKRGDHKAPESPTSERFESHSILLEQWKSGPRRVLCGQERSYCPISLEDWYAKVAPSCGWFKPHPKVGGNVKGLKTVNDFNDCGYAITLNSSVAIECLIKGIPVEVHDEGGLAYGHKLLKFHNRNADRLEFFAWLAHTQWHWSEIEAGEPIRHLFEWL
jgi:hypothetical protein